MFKKSLLPALIVSIILIFSIPLAAASISDDFIIPPYPNVPAGEENTMEYVASYLLQTAGLKESQLGVYPRDHISMAQSVGLFEGVNFVQGAECCFEDYLKMANNLEPLYRAMNAQPMAPFFVNGSAQPIFEFGDVVRFVVYVESNFDTDEDGKLDLIKAVIQLPKKALEGMKVASIYEAIPYTAGTNGSPYDPPFEAPPGSTYDINKLYSTPPARIPAGITTTAEHAKLAKASDWTYYYGANASGSANCFNNVNSYNYYLIRGFAVILSAGRGTAQSEGISTCGSDVEIDGYKVVIDWLNGNAKAYTNRTDNIEIKAEWSNGNVGMTGTSYGGTTQFGLATTGVKGLKAIVPVAGIASWYEYTNLQGSYNTLEYAYNLAWYVDSRYRNLAPFGDTSTTDHANSIQSLYGLYMRQLRTDEGNSTGDYITPHWSARDYTNTEYGYYDWAKITCPALIVHGLNDENVRPKQSDLMYKAYTKAGTNVKLLFHQGVHITPNTLMPGQYNYRELLNKWWSHYLYDVDNGIEDMPAVTVESNIDGTWEYYDSWDAAGYRILGHNDPQTTPTKTINSYYSSHSPAITSSNFRNYFLANETPHNTIYSVKIDEDMIIKGVVEVNIRASVDNYSIPAGQPFIAPPPNVPEPGEWDMYLKDGALDWDAINEGLDSGDIDHNLVMMLLRDYGSNSGNTLNPTPAPEADAAAATAISRQDNIIISAMLVDFCDDPFNIYIAPGSSSISYTTLVSGGIWFGGGLSNANLQKINQVAAPRNTINNKYYEVISYGKMDMANPNAKYDSYTADRKDRVDLEPGKFYDLSLYLQPNLYKVKAGHTLALVLFAYYPGFGAGQPSTAQGQYAITIDNTATYASIPLDLPKTFDVTFFANGQVYDEQEVIMGQKAIVPDTPQKARYIFNGWFTDETGGVKWDFSKAITADLNLYAQWTKYDFTVFLAPQKTSVNVGETFYVDIMLEGSLNYTQVFTEINYDTDLLEFAGFSELQGWVAAVNKIAPNLVSVRSMPSMNMLMGEPCFEPIKIVTLAFNAKDNFNTASITTDLGFSSVMVTPPGGYLGAIIDPGNAVTLTLNK